MPKSEKYWQDRQERKYLAGEKKVNDYYKGLKKSFEMAKRDIQYVINGLTLRYSLANNMTYADAMRALNRSEIGELQDFIDRVRANMGKYDLQLENMSVKARITRYEAMLMQVDALVQQLYAVEYQYKGEELLKEVYADSYYQTWFNIDQYHGFHQEFAQINPTTIDELIRYPFDGADFSTRLWKQKGHMLQQLNESITSMLIQGRNPLTMTKEFSKKFDTKEFEAYRLLHTEGSFIMEQASQAAYKEDGVEKYRWLATLDIKTCDRCREKDGKTYDVDKAVVGVNMPPLHSLDRCTTVPAYDDDDLTQEKRVARDPVTGKGYEVPADMNYEQWHKEFIESNPEAIQAEKKWKNRQSDKLQYERYKNILGEDYLPKTFDEFQKLKYSGGIEYGILKAQAKGMSYYNKALINEPGITEHVKKVAESTGMDILGLKYRIKSRSSFLEKIEKNYNPDGNEYEIKDIVRYTLGTDPDSLVDKTLQSIDKLGQEGYNTVRIKNTWGVGSSYNGINTFIKDPNGQVFEMQYHTKESFDLKNGELHELYERQRKITDDESEEYLEIEDKMIELSSKLTFPKNIERVKNK
ncbi:MAG: phage head morphosis protein family [Lachnospiraceae bacterium]|jgi:SPP1 gp7 family putative phage head morphogenesis protein|nr:phage head morphosis protein family [Lachnospiraceae bacterium]